MPAFLIVNEILINDFFYPISNVIHFSPLRLLVSCFELFGYTLTLCHLLYQSRKNFLCLLVNIGKVAVQLPTCEQSGACRSFMLLKIAFVSLPPYADRLVFFFGG